MLTMLLTDIAVNCGGKGGKPGPCKTVFDQGGTEIGSAVSAVGSPAPTPTSGPASAPGDPNNFLSDFDKKNIARLVKEADKSLTKKSSAEINNMTPDQLQAEMNSVFSPLSISSIDGGQAVQDYADAKVADKISGSHDADAYVEKAFNLPGGVAGTAFLKEYGVETPLEFANKLIKTSDKAVAGPGKTSFYKIWQSPLVSAFANAAKASPYYKKLQAAKAKAETPKPVKPTKPTKMMANGGESTGVRR